MSTAGAPRTPGRKKQTPEERALVGRLTSGDPEALGQLYDQYSGMLLGLAYKILGRQSDAEEVLQEVFLQVWRQATRYDAKRSSLSTWLVLITRSRSIDRLRSRRVVDKTVTAAEQEKTQQHTSPQGIKDVFKHERRQRLDEELSKLPDEQKQVLDMAFFQGMTQSEIAGKTGIPLGTVKTRTLLAMRKLRKALHEEIEDLL